MVTLKMDTSTQVHILNKADNISYIANTLGKDRDPTILPPAMDK